MAVETYLRALRQFWWLPLILLVMCLVAVGVYQNHSKLYTAQSTVGVLDPVVARAGGAGEAQIGFDSIVKSQVLAERVAKRIGGDPGVIHSRITLTVLPPAAGSLSNASPVFAVSGSDPNPKRAILLTDTAVDEAQKLFFEYNTPHLELVTTALQPAVDAANAKLAQAQKDFQAFTTANNAANLPARISKQEDLVYSLELSVRSAQADQAATTGAPASVQLALAQKTANLQRSLATEEDTLGQLTRLQGQYDELSNKVAVAQQGVDSLGQVEQALVLTHLAPDHSEVKVLDRAMLQSNTLTTVLIEGVAVVVGLMLGAGAIYLIALMGALPQTAEEVGEAFGRPVLVHLPRVLP